MDKQFTRAGRGWVEPRGGMGHNPERRHRYSRREVGSPVTSVLAAERFPVMVAKTAASTAPTPAPAETGAPRPWHQSHFHVKIACDAVAVAILLAVVALYLVIALLA